jgi:hypothetical protein
VNISSAFTGNFLIEFYRLAEQIANERIGHFSPPKLYNSRRGTQVVHPAWIDQHFPGPGAEVGGRADEGGSAKRQRIDDGRAAAAAPGGGGGGGGGGGSADATATAGAGAAGASSETGASTAAAAAGTIEGSARGPTGRNLALQNAINELPRLLADWRQRVDTLIADARTSLDEPSTDVEDQIIQFQASEALDHLETGLNNLQHFSLAPLKPPTPLTNHLNRACAIAAIRCVCDLSPADATALRVVPGVQQLLNELDEVSLSIEESLPSTAAITSGGGASSAAAAAVPAPMLTTTETVTSPRLSELLVSVFNPDERYGAGVVLPSAKREAGGIAKWSGLSSSTTVCTTEAELFRHLPGKRYWHFTGHADITHDGERTLGLLNQQGVFAVVKRDTIVSHVGSLDVKPELVVLNGCSSAELADALVRVGVRWAVCWETKVNDLAAAAFAQGFWEAIGRGAGVPEAFEAGRGAIERVKEPGKLDTNHVAMVPRFVIKDPAHANAKTRRLPPEAGHPQGRLAAGVPALMHQLPTERVFGAPPPPPVSADGSSPL